MTIDLFLCGFKGLKVLQHLCSSKYVGHINTVVAARDHKVLNDYFDDISITSQKHGLNFLDRENDEINAKADYRFVIGWRWMINVTENTIVFHDSLLPAYRGFAPLVNALINGDNEIGATAIFAEKDYDTGPIITNKRISVAHPVRIQKVIDEISKLYIGMIDEIIGNLLKGQPPATTPQDESKASYSLWRDEKDYMINWEDSSDKILRTIYALSFPYPGAQTLLNGSPIIIQDAEVFDDVKIINRDAGKVIFVSGGCPVVVCGKGLLRILSASNDQNESIIPLKNFRSRFGV